MYKNVRICCIAAVGLIRFYYVVLLLVREVTNTFNILQFCAVSVKFCLICKNKSYQARD